MSNLTQNVGLELTPEVTDETFKAWRQKINGEINSNMTKIDEKFGEIDEDINSNQTPTFTQASSRTNIASGDNLPTLFGKIKKFFADLKTVAFTGNIADLVTKNHASTSTTYGKGTGVDYGHVMLSDSTSYNSKDTNGIAATPYAVKTAYDKASAASKAADIVIAAYDASDDWKAAADYVCDGKHDQVEINQAITQLGNQNSNTDGNDIKGGKILLSSGTFFVTDYIELSSKELCLQGMGDSTSICVANNISTDYLFTSNNFGRLYITLKDFCICNNASLCDSIIDNYYCKNLSFDNITLKSAYSIPSYLGYTARSFSYNDNPGLFWSTLNLVSYIATERFRLINCRILTDYKPSLTINNKMIIDKLYIHRGATINLNGQYSIVDIVTENVNPVTTTINVTGYYNKIIKNPGITINNSGTNNIIA